MEIDWLKAGTKERVELYKVTRAIANLTNQSVEDVLELAFNRPLDTSSEYVGGFRKGKIARYKAKMVYAWIAEHHIDAARKITPDLFPVPQLDIWEQYLAEQAIHGKLRLVNLKNERGIVQRAGSVREVDQALALDDEFCFELDSEMDGTAIAFQEYRGKWHPLPLGMDEVSLDTEIRSGKQLLPYDEYGRPLVLLELEDTGIHKFVFVLASEEMPKVVPDQFDLALSEHITTHCMTVQVTG